MPELLEVWGVETAANVQKVIWCLRELGRPYVARGVGFDGGTPRDAVYLRVRGDAASPVLRDGAFVLWEGNAIVRYLVERYGDGSLYPRDLAARADIDRWMDYQLSTIRPPLHALLRASLGAPDVARQARNLAAAMEPLEATLATQPYLAGATFTIADIPTGINAWRWQILDVERPPAPAIDAWIERLQARPAFAAIRPPADTSVALRER
ncbi:MAG: glutathione S-transferase family protein [Candidatus Lustribacter sp.]